MSFHLDLDLSADCDIWRRILQHENLVEKQSVGTLAGVYSKLPPPILSSFLTHRHTHTRLLPADQQRYIEKAVAAKEFTFEPNPSYDTHRKAEDVLRGDLQAMTHTELLKRHVEPNHLPNDARLDYLYPPDYLNKMQLFPRSAKSYAKGQWFDCKLAIAAKPSNPHPGLRAHPETSTYRRATHGRRHAPFPATSKVSHGTYAQTARPTTSNAYPPEEKFVDPSPKEDNPANGHFPPASYITPVASQASLNPAPAAPHKQQLDSSRFPHYQQPTPVSFPTQHTPSFAPHPPQHPAGSPTATPTYRPHASLAPLAPLRNAPSAPLSQTFSQQSSPQPLEPTPSLQTPRKFEVRSATAQLYTRPSPSIIRAQEQRQLAASQGGSTASAGPGAVARADKAGFAQHAFALYNSPKIAETLLTTIPTSYAAFAEHRYDHTSSFGSNGVFQAVPTTKPDQGLQTSRGFW